VLVTFAYAAHLLVTAIAGAVLWLIRPRDPRDDGDDNGGTNTALGAYATALGVAAAALTVLQYFPQLHTTWRRKAAGSLSIPMMLIQTPGAFVWAGSLAARLGWAGWSAWGMFVVSGCLQGVLLAMTVTYELRARRLRSQQQLQQLQQQHQQERWRQQGMGGMGARGEEDEEERGGAGGVRAYSDEGEVGHEHEHGSQQRGQ
jgi:membrane associated rhomboid family serine protease